MTVLERNEQPVRIGIDAAVVADHQIAIRGPGIRDDFRASPTLAGMAKLTERLAPYAGSLVVVEPTAGTWLPLTMAVTEAGCRIGFVQNRDSAQLRKAITGRTKTDVVDADMLARCETVLDIEDAPVPAAGQIGLRRALQRRHRMTVDAHRAECRLWALCIWAMPDVWRAAGGHAIAQPLLGRWPDLRAIGRARLSSITEIVAAHSRDQRPRAGGPNASGPRRRDGTSSGSADSTSTIWRGRSPRCATTSTSPTNVNAKPPTTPWTAGGITGPTTCSPPCSGVGPICAATTRAWWGDGRHLRSAKAAGRVHRTEPVELGIRPVGVAVTVDHQRRPRR